MRTAKHPAGMTAWLQRLVLISAVGKSPVVTFCAETAASVACPPNLLSLQSDLQMPSELAGLMAGTNCHLRGSICKPYFSI